MRSVISTNRKSTSGNRRSALEIRFEVGVLNYITANWVDGLLLFLAVAIAIIKGRITSKMMPKPNNSIISMTHVETLVNLEGYSGD